MKIWIRKMISVLAVCAMVIGLGVPVRTQAAQPDTDTYVQQLIAYYRDDQEDAETDIARVLSEMAEVDTQKADHGLLELCEYGYAGKPQCGAGRTCAR